MPKLKITNTIRRLRFDNNEMTQQTLAEQVGVTRQTIAAIEKAKYSPSLELAIMIARVFGKPLDEVFMVEGEQAPQPKRDARPTNDDPAGEE
jgi:putative transcriptional regulator